jgi:hypothetical protein
MCQIRLVQYRVCLTVRAIKQQSVDLLSRYSLQLLGYFAICFYRMSEKSLEAIGILFIIYYLHYMLYMFTTTLYIFSRPLYHVCADFAQHIGIDSSTRVCISLPKVTKVSDFNSIHLCFKESPKCKTSTLSPNVNAIFSLLIFNFSL